MAIGLECGQDEKGLDEKREPFSLPPYHVFTKFGEHFVYLLSTAQFFHIDLPAFSLLTLCLEVPLEEAKQRLVQQSVCPPDEIDGAAPETEFLAAHGLFDVPDLALTAREVDRQLETWSRLPRRRLELCLADTCNLACKYCYCGTSRNTEPVGLMSEAVAKPSAWPHV